MLDSPVSGGDNSPSSSSQAVITGKSFLKRLSSIGIE